MVTHELRISQETIQVGVFDNSIPPVLTIEAGDTVELETATHWGDSVTPDTILDDVIQLRTQVYPSVGPHSLTGPIEVKGSRPGQLLKVDVIELVPREHGFNLNLPAVFGTGLLPEDFPDGQIRHFRHDLAKMTTVFRPGITVPLVPFLGIMGVAPESPGAHSTVAPGVHGGNIDLALLGPGASLYLPVWVEGAMFSAGDAHSRQGNGEVCLTAIETAMEKATLRFELIDDTTWRTPFAETRDRWITLGMHEDLLEACRLAIKDMIRLMGDHYRIPAADAYSLCSVAVDLSVTQVVNTVRGVHATLEKSYFSS